MDASHDLSERVDQARLLESGGACDSPSWNLGRAKQGDTIRVDGTSSRGRGQGASECQASERERGRMHDHGERRECDETSRPR